MRIREMVILQRQTEATEAAKNQNLIPKKRLNSDGLAGMDITGMNPSDFKTVRVSDDIREKLIGIMKNVFLENYGIDDGQQISAAMRKYTASVPEKDRVHVSWTLGNIVLDEHRRLENLALENIPNWKPGKPFDRDFVSSFIGGIDRKV